MILVAWLSNSKCLNILRGASYFFCASLWAQVGDTKPGVEKRLVGIEIVRSDNFYISDRGIREAQVIWKTDAAVLYQVRRGHNCRTGEPLDKVAYSGVTTSEKENILKISAMSLKPGVNTLVICVNRVPLSDANSQQLDYGADVYEKNLTFIVDNNPPVTVAEYKEAENGTLLLSCYDEGVCDGISYSFEGAGRKEEFHEKEKKVMVTIDNARSWVESVRYFSSDKAGNREPAKEFKVSRGNYPWFGSGRLSVFPVYLMRLDAKQSYFSAGLGAGFAGDFGLAQLIDRVPKPYFPGLRVEGKLFTFSDGANTEDGLGEIASGLIWLVPFRNGSLGTFSAGTTFGIAKYFSIINARQVSSVVAWSANVFVGYEYAYKKIFAFAHWRYMYVAAAPDVFSGHGPAVGVGMVF